MRLPWRWVLFVFFFVIEFVLGSCLQPYVHITRQKKMTTTPPHMMAADSGDSMTRSSLVEQCRLGDCEQARERASERVAMNGGRSTS